ncbi:MAG: hypothetical protein WKF75_09840 [Singulisphaera sp.]
MAIVLYTTAVFLFIRELLLPYFSLYSKVIESIFGPLTSMTTAKSLIILPVAVAVQVLPQLILARVGGSLALIVFSLFQRGRRRT